MDGRDLSAADFLACAKAARRIKRIGPLPGGDGDEYVYVRSLTERELSSYQAGLVNGKTGGIKPDSNRRLLALVLSDAEGRALLTPGDAELLGEMDAARVQYIVNEAIAHLGLKQEDIDALAKN